MDADDKTWSEKVAETSKKIGASIKRKVVWLVNLLANKDADSDDDDSASDTATGAQRTIVPANIDRI